MSEKSPNQRLKRADRDIVALGIATAAIILFVATGSAVLPETVRSLTGRGTGPDNLLVVAFHLNIALVIFGWRRYRELKDEISERKRAEEQARELAEMDPLTGCLNRRSMGRATNKLCEVAHAEGQAVAFVMVDLDNFKQINDMHGHMVGDQVLVALADRIASQLPNQGQLARIGGDEFAFVVPFDAKSPERIDDLVIRLFERATPSFELDGITLETTMSIGIATDIITDAADPVVADANELMHRADIAMYHAKNQGKNRFFWFEPNMENELRFRNELETGIRRGLTEREFVPFYEQQIDLDSGKLVGFEMLARWRSPQLGLISPETFIPIAEEIGLIGELSDQLMVQAFADASEWDDALTLSINISPVQLRDPWFAQKLLKLLVKEGLPPQRLEVEITESCLHDNIGMVRSMITSLRNQGVQISLDDFGTGYSSLEQLRTLPFDGLKIDRSFVSELGDPNARSTIVDAIISLGQGLDLPITVEGIEDENILSTFKSVGRLKGQGYLYGRPETADEVRERLGKEGLLAEKKTDTKRREAPIKVSESGPRRIRAAQ